MWGSNLLHQIRPLRPYHLQRIDAQDTRAARPIRCATDYVEDRGRRQGKKMSKDGVAEFISASYLRASLTTEQWRASCRAAREVSSPWRYSGWSSRAQAVQL